MKKKIIWIETNYTSSTPSEYIALCVVPNGFSGQNTVQFPSTYWNTVKKNLDIFSVLMTVIVHQAAS